MKNLKSFALFESEGIEDEEVQDIDEFNENDENFDGDDDEFNDEYEDGEFEDGDYSEASWNMDKFMYDDPDVQDDFYEILYRKDIEELEEFLHNNIQDEDRFHSYISENGTVKGFAQWLIDNISEGQPEN